MLVAFTFRAKAGKEQEFERLLDNPHSGIWVTKAFGAFRNTLFPDDGVMVRLFEFPEGAEPTTQTNLARQDPKVKEFLQSLSALIEDDFDRRTSPRLARDARYWFVDWSISK